MRTLKMYPTSINELYIDEIVTALLDGQLIVYPTDTHYAVGCDALNNRAIELVCQLKDIDSRRHPLSIICADISQASAYARIDNTTFSMLHSLTPGPFTFILHGTPALPKIFKGRKEVGVRIPDNAIARAIARALGHPLMTSSIPAGMDVPEQNIAYTIDGGDVPQSDSAIISCLDPSAPEVIRQGLGKI